MARPSKILPEYEEQAREQLEAGLSFDEMVEWYEAISGISTSPAAWARKYKQWFSEPRRKRTQPLDPDGWQLFLPWIHAQEDSMNMAAGMEENNYPDYWEHFRFMSALYTLWKLSDGCAVAPEDLAALARVKHELAESGSVIDLVEGPGGGFRPVPRRAGIDKGWIRDPFYNDDGTLIPAGVAAERVWPKAFVELYPFDVEELTKPPV